MTPDSVTSYVSANSAIAADTSKTNATSRIPIVTTDLHAKFPSTTSTSRKHAALHVPDALSDVVTTSPKVLGR
jgi:hypothetical protein